MCEGVPHADEGIEPVADQVADVLRQAQPVRFLNNWQISLNYTQSIMGEILNEIGYVKCLYLLFDNQICLGPYKLISMELFSRRR